jgi:Domain of unknown function (DUF4167)
LNQGRGKGPHRPQRQQNVARLSRHMRRPSKPGNPRQAAANARSRYESYITMARDAASRGDTIEAENLYQHAEHYFRVLREQE